MPIAINQTVRLDFRCLAVACGAWPLGELRAIAVNTPLTITIDDAELLRRVAQRDRQAFSQLYDRYAGVLHSTILRILNNHEEASDVLQEVFLQMWDKAPAYDPALGKPFNWALTMTRNKAIDRLRSLQRRYSFLDKFTVEMEGGCDNSPGPGDAFTPDQAALIRAAVTTLPLEQREAIEMAFLGGLTQNEIATALQQPLGTIKARIRRGMLRLREALKDIV